MIKNSDQIIKLIEKSKNIVLMGHKDGDGDCFGAMIGLSYALTKIGKNVRLLSNENLPDYLQFLNHDGKIVFNDNYWDDADCLIILDTSGLNILSSPEIGNKYFESSATSVLIDHHTRGNVADRVDLAWVDQKYCSASEMVFELLKIMRVPFDPDIATALFTGIVTDTSSFQNQNTTAETFLAASELVKQGANLYEVIENNYYSKSPESLKIRGLVLDRLIINKKYNAVISYVKNRDLVEYNIDSNAITGHVDYLKKIKGVKLVVFIAEKEPGKIRVSLRTRDQSTDVAKIARALGGGGHVKAAGFLVDGRITNKGSNTIIA